MEGCHREKKVNSHKSGKNGLKMFVVGGGKKKFVLGVTFLKSNRLKPNFISFGQKFINL